MANQVGIQINRAVAGPLAFGPDPGDSLFIALLAERGPADVPTLISSFSRFKTTFGGASPFASETNYAVGYEVLRRFFDKGGRRAYVTRIIGSAALEAYTDLQDRDGVPLGTLRIYGKGEGTWANGFDVRIVDGTKTDTFKIIVYDDTIGSGGEVVETFDNLKMTSAYLEKVNSKSNYIRLENLNSTTATPGNLPAAGDFSIGATQPGVDDNAPSAADIVGTEASGVKTGLKAFRSTLYGRGFLIAPDMDTAATVRSEMIAQSEAFYRMPFFGSQEAATPTAAVADLTGLQAFNAGYYYPRAIVEDALTEELKTIPVVGHIVADYLKAIQAKGPGKAPAGRDFKINFVYGLETQSNGQPLVDSGVAETLISNGINPIYDRDGTGPKCWGGRSTSDDAAWQYLHAGYLWCRIASAVQDALDGLVYEVADAQLFSQILQGIYSFLCDLHRQGAFSGRIPLLSEDVDPDEHAFAVTCDESLLSDEDRNNGIVRAELWFRPALTAETVIVQVAKRNA